MEKEKTKLRKFIRDKFTENKTKKDKIVEKWKKQGNLDIPCRISYCAKSGSGKTYNAFISYIYDEDSPFNPFNNIASVIYVSPPQSAQQKIVKLSEEKLGEENFRENYDGGETPPPPFLSVVTNSDGIDKKSADFIKKMIRNNFNEDIHTLIIFDDFMTARDRRTTSFISSFFISGRHMNVSVLELNQRVFVDSQSRINRIQSDRFYIGNLATPDEAKNLFMQLYPDRWKEILKNWKYSISNNYRMLRITPTTSNSNNLQKKLELCADKADCEKKIAFIKDDN